MAVTGTFQYYGTQLTMNVYEESTNYGGNYSTLRVHVYMYQPNNNKPWSLDAVNSFSASVSNGASWGWAFGYDHRGGNGDSTWLVDTTTIGYHNSTGSATFSYGASASCDVIGSANTGTGYAGTTDFAFPPAAPTASVSRSADGTSMTVTSTAPSSAATITDYNYRYSTDNSTWSAAQAMGTDRSEVFTGTSTQDYWFQTRAYSSEGWGSWSSSVSVQGVPTAPTSVVGTASTSVSGRITVTWTAPSDTNGGITNYYVYRDGTYVGQTGNATASYIDDGLTKGTSYVYTVRAYNAIGYSALSSGSTATQAPGVPYAATLNSVTASTDTFGKVTLSWTAPSTAVGTIQNYYMYATFGGVIEKTVSTSSATTSGDITGLDLRKVYTFYVRARNQFSIDNGTPGDQSNTLTKKSPGPPTAPTSLTSNAPFFPPGTIDLNWTAPSDVGTDGGTITGYSIYLAGSSTPVVTTTGTGTTATVADLIPATAYTFNVRARNEIADVVGTFSDASNSTTATAQGEPDAPTNLTVVSDPIVAGRLILTWTPPVGYNTGFRIYTGDGTLLANISVPRYEIDGLIPNNTYSYKVRARNPLTDLTGSEGGPFSATVSGVVGATSTQTVPSIAVANSTNNTFVGTYNLVSTTATTMSYSKAASNISFATVPVNGGATANNTNTNLNGTYTVTAVGTQATSTAITYTKAGSDIAANTSTPSGTMYNNTNAIFNGNYEVLSFPAPDPVLKTVSYSKVSSNISSRVASGPITNNSNATYNGEYVISDVAENTISYSKTSSDIEESDAFGTVYNKTNQDIFNGTFTLTDTPDHKTVEYSTGDLVYSENLVTNPSFEFVNTGTDVIRTNLVPNPSMETNVTSWVTSNSSIARSSDVSKYGTHSGLVSPSSNTGNVSILATLPASGTYTYSVWVYVSDAKNIKLSYSGTSGSTVALTADTWTRLSATFTGTSGSVSVGVESVDSTNPFYIDGVLLESGAYALPYFDGASTDELGWDYGWTGTAHASTSTAKAAATSSSPTAKGVTNVSSSSVLTGASPRSGTYCLSVTPATNTGGISVSATTVIGSIYTFSGWVSSSSKNLQASVNTTTPTLGGVVAASGSSWTRISVSFTATGTTSVLSILGTDSTAVFKVDDIMLEESGSVGNYFDGDTDATTTTWPVVYSWAGTPHDSISTREVGGTLPSIGSEILLPYGQASRVDSEANLQIQYRSGWIG